MPELTPPPISTPARNRLTAFAKAKLQESTGKDELTQPERELVESLADYVELHYYTEDETDLHALEASLLQVRKVKALLWRDEYAWRVLSNVIDSLKERCEAQERKMGKR